MDIKRFEIISFQVSVVRLEICASCFIALEMSARMFLAGIKEVQSSLDTR